LFEIGELEKLIAEETEDSEPEGALPGRKRKKMHGRRVIPDGLPEEVIQYELPESERTCPVDGQVMERIRWEESKQLDYVPARLKVIVHRRAVYACPEKHDEATLATAPKPPQPVEKGLAAAGLLAQVVVSKFGDHLPGYRQEDIFSRHGVNIRRSTLYDWLASVADLCEPLVELMKSEVLASNVIHTDDTQVKLVDKSLRGTRLARFWGYLGDKAHPYAVYDFTEDRSRDGPQKFLKDYQGYLQADAYGGYDGIYLKSNSDGSTRCSGVVEVACWTHCRRYWHKAREQDPQRAHHVLAIIGRLYEVERACADRSAEFRQARRVEHAVPLLQSLESWLGEQEFLPKSLIGKAATYTRNQWQALNRYVENGELSIDNNFAERAMRPIAIGRKNWLFVGSHTAGKRAAILTSLIASCKHLEVEPWAYLKDVLAQLARNPSPAELANLLPDRWLTQNPSHQWRIAHMRKAQRESNSKN
jgi:transposase